MKLYEGEPAFVAAEFVELESLAQSIKAVSVQRPIVIGIDGRSGGGKTTLARNLAELLEATMLSTDDFAWWHSFFDWPEMLIENGIEPLRAGNAIDFKPAAWIEQKREGSIQAQPNRFIIVEGVGSTQASMRPALDIKIWVQADANVAKQRGLLRDLSERPDPEEAERFWNEWQAAEDVFQVEQQSWLTADYRVAGN